MSYVKSIILIIIAAVHKTCQYGIAESSNDFGFSLFKTFPEGQNVFFSPSSVYIALNMLYAGANGTTAEEMRQVLKYNDDEVNHQSFNSLLGQLKNGSNEYALDIANILLTQASYPVLNEYKDVLQRYYHALLKEVDFASNNQQTLNEINEWVNEKTNGKISQFLKTLPADTKMAILNAVYFKGYWETPFNPNLTIDGTFYNDGMNPVSVRMMVLREVWFPYQNFDDEYFEAIELPYKGEEISMVIILPETSDKLSLIEKSLNSAKLKSIISELELHKLTVKVPKFKLEDSRHLRENLTTLGMTSAFEVGADFSGINQDKNLCISEVLHKAVFEINEEGSEAAAVSAVISTYSYPRKFSVDHPFLFFIRDNRNKMILFFGRVTRL